MSVPTPELKKGVSVPTPTLKKGQSLNDDPELDDIIGIGRKIICYVSNRGAIYDVEFREGMFDKNSIKYGRIFTTTTIRVGTFNDYELDGYGK